MNCLDPVRRRVFSMGCERGKNLQMELSRGSEATLLLQGVDDQMLQEKEGCEGGVREEEGRREDGEEGRGGRKVSKRRKSATDWRKQLEREEREERAEGESGREGGEEGGGWAMKRDETVASHEIRCRSELETEKRQIVEREWLGQQRGREAERRPSEVDNKPLSSS